MNRIGLDQLPPLRKEGFSLRLHTSPSPLRLKKDKEKRGPAIKDCQRDLFFYSNWQRDEINSKILERLYENEKRLAKEILKKEISLQEKMEKAVKTLRKVQVRTAFWDKVKEEQRNTWNAENYSCYTEKGNCDRRHARVGTLRGRRHGGQQFNNLVRGEAGREKQKNVVKDTNASRKAIRTEEAEWKYKGRNTQRGILKEWEHPEKMTWPTRKRVQTEKNGTSKEKAVELQWNKRRDENEMARACDGEKRRHKMADRQIVCSSPPLRLPPLNLSQHQARGTVSKEVFETNGPEPLPNDGPSIQNIKSKKQVELIPESSSNINFQPIPCEICHRKFKEDRLEKHIRICHKTPKNKCKVYDSSQHRIQGTQIEEFLKNNKSKTPESVRQARAPAARGVQPKEDPYSDYVTCPHCSRRFAPGPAETHIPKCQNIKRRPPPPRQRHRM